MSESKPCSSVGIQWGFWIWNNALYAWVGGSGYVPPSEEYENFTTYNEVDPNNHIACTANHIDWTSKRNETAYSYKDKGINHFADFVHKIDVKLVSGDIYCTSPFYALTNDLGNLYNLKGNQKPWIAVRMAKAENDVVQFLLTECLAGTEYHDITLVGDNFLINTMYYCTITKSGTSLTCKIYTDSARTTLKKTLSLTLHNVPLFRYMMTPVSWNDNQAYTSELDIEKLLLQ
jgi:hypothetical protein